MKDVEVIIKWMDETKLANKLLIEVAGANTRERNRLQILGGLVHAMLGRHPEKPTEPVYKIPEVREWLGSGSVVDAGAIEALDRLILDDADVGLAKLYAATVSAKNRRNLGTFFTPRSEVEAILEIVRTRNLHPKSIIDVGAGVGIFTTGTAKEWPLANIHSVDVNPVTLGLLGLRVVQENILAASGQKTPGVHLHLCDFFDYLTDRFPELPEPRLIIGNPPYTRAHLLPPAQRSKAINAANGLCGSRASLSALMTSASVIALAASDATCLLLPAQWLESTYAIELRSYLWCLVSREVHLRLFDAAVFTDARVDSVALYVGPRTSKPTHFTVESDRSGLIEIDRRKSCPKEWRSFFDRCEHGGLRERVESQLVTESESVPLKQIATVRRGTATGANTFFTLSDAQVTKWKLPRSALRPLVRRLRVLDNSVVTLRHLEQLGEHEPRWLFVPGGRVRATSRALAYIKSGETEGYDHALLCTRRPVWYWLEREIVEPSLIVGPSTRASFRIVVNAAKAGILNNLYGITWRREISEEIRVSTTEWLRSPAGQYSLKKSARRQGDGLWKIEISDLQELQVPIQTTGTGESLRITFLEEFELEPRPSGRASLRGGKA